jgi:hypothetical protein
LLLRKAVGILAALFPLVTCLVVKIILSSRRALGSLAKEV